jgi:hypothetical protein
MHGSTESCVLLANPNLGQLLDIVTKAMLSGITHSTILLCALISCAKERLVP